MKLQFVKLTSLQQLPQGSTDELRPEIHGEIVFVPEEQIVKVAGQVFPMSQIRRMEPEEAQVPCPECKELFIDNRALGAHRSYVHKIRGKSRK